MTPPDYERTKAEHTALAVRVARDSKLYSELSETTNSKSEKGSLMAPLFALSGCVFGFSAAGGACPLYGDGA
jgi:hypothetical protein